MMETWQIKDLSGAWMWTPHTWRTCHVAAVRLCCFYVIVFNLLMDGDLSPWLRLTCLWVILTMTEGGRGVDIYISQTLSRWWMERPSSPCRCPYSTAMVNEKWHTCLSLFNEHKVPSVWCMCFMRVRAGTRQRDGKENWVKLFVIIWVLHFIVPIQVSIATHTV